MPMDLPATGTVERARDQSGTLAQRISTSPDLADASDARARVNDWLDEIADTAAGKTLIRLFAAHSLLNALISGLAEGSRYLWELVRADPQRLVSLLEAEPERRFDEILADARGAIAAAQDEPEVMHLLRRMKAEAALLIALADIGGVWPVMQVIERQTRLADAAVGSAVDYLFADAQRRGKLKSSERQGPRGTAPASSSSPWARWERASSTIRATSTLSCSTTTATPAIRSRAGAVLRAAHADAGEASAGAHRRRLRVPHRSAAASGSSLDPDRGLDGGGARLLREPGAELGARRADQGASLCRRYRGRRRHCSANSRLSSGANTWTSRRSPTFTP